MDIKQLNDVLNVNGKRTRAKDPIYNKIMNESMNVDNRVTSSLANPVELVDDNWLERNTYDGGYDDQLYKHKSVMAKKIKKAKKSIGSQGEVDRMMKSFLEARNDPYRANGIDVDKRTGDFIGDVVGRLF